MHMGLAQRWPCGPGTAHGPVDTCLRAPRLPRRARAATGDARGVADGGESRVSCDVDHVPAGVHCGRCAYGGGRGENTRVTREGHGQRFIF